MPQQSSPAGGSQSLHPPFGVVAVAASAGGLGALTSILSQLGGDFPVPLLVVQHLDRTHPSFLAEILGRRTRLKVKQAENGEHISAGRVYVAVPDFHLLVNSDHTLSLTRTQLVHHVRPAADVLFESVALSFGPRAIALVATGTGSDGARGVSAVKKAGGVVLVQDEGSSEFFGMPGAAIGTGDVDLVLSLKQIPGALKSLVAGASLV